MGEKKGREKKGGGGGGGGGERKKERERSRRKDIRQESKENRGEGVGVGGRLSTESLTDQLRRGSCLQLKSTLGVFAFQSSGKHLHLL